MSSVTYMNADLFETTNILTMTTHLLKQENKKFEGTAIELKECYDLFVGLQQTDYDVLYKRYRHVYIFLNCIIIVVRLSRKTLKRNICNSNPYYHPNITFYRYLEKKANNKLDNYEAIVHEK